MTLYLDMPHKVEFLSGLPEYEKDVPLMKFRLTYEGELRATQRNPEPNQTDPLAVHKHHIRRCFHKQLKHFWSQNDFLREYRIHPNDVKGGIQVDTRPINISVAVLGHHQSEKVHLSEYISRKFRENGYRFCPLVCEDFSLQCYLDILFLRRDVPGSALQAGDIDNRVKTIIDALQKPRNGNELCGNETPNEGEDPFFCLLEEDKLLNQFSVETDTLLDPPTGELADKKKAKVIITVQLKPYFPTYFNMAFS